MLVLSQSIRHPAVDPISCSRFRILQVFIVGIMTIAALGVGSVSSLAVDRRRLLEGTTELAFEARSGEPQFELLHWSHPRSPIYVPGLSLAERFEHAVRKSRERAAGLSRGIPVGMVASANSSNENLEYPLTTKIQPPPTNFIGYGMEITIGTPPQTFSGIADTGSALVWVQCLPCANCIAQPDPLFDPTKSSTYEGVSCSDPMCLAVQSSCNGTCQYQYSYPIGKTTGELARETITLNTATGKSEIAKDFVFGCGHHDDVDALLNLDGVVALGRGPLSFTSQLGSLYGNKFSYCLVSLYHSSNKTSPLLFGNSSIPKVSTQYTPMLQNPNQTAFAASTFYYIGLQGINVNGVPLDIPSDAFDFAPDGSGGVISDSGTPFTVLVEVAFNPLLSMMQSLIKYPVIPGPNYTAGIYFDLCYDLSSVPNPIFPNVTFVFDGMSLDLPEENVFVLVPGYHNATCMAILEGGFQMVGPGSIFGSVQQQNFQYLHDREANRYGFAKVQCDTLCSG